MKILYYASVDFYTKPNPSFHLMYTMIEDLLNAGHQVYFVGCMDQNVEKHIPDEFTLHPSFSYDLIKIPAVAKSQFARRYFAGIRYAIASKKYLRKARGKYDLVFVQSSPTVLYNLCVARRNAGSARILYNVQDMFPGSSIASGVMPRKWMQRVFFALQKIAYAKADKISVISEDMKAKVIEQGVPEDKVEVIVNWFDDASVHEIPWDENQFIQKYHMDRQNFYVQYAGTMGYVFDYEMVLNVAERLLQYPDIVIQMIGEGSQKQAFIEAARKRSLINIAFLPLEAQNMVADVYSACSVCFIPLKRGIIGNSVPSKAGLLMACKRAIVSAVDEDSDYYRMVNDNAGISVSNLDAGAAAEAILTLYRNRDKCVEFGRRGYAYGRDLYSRSNNIKKYFALFRELVGEEG